ncbi:AraC family transcriptional regulator [Vibrio galatheae]|uniref:AraC family transcriptional regulator n=1 Tax=Vibrio galatheae TaxID=579748 RepID=A0A0F4NGA3_9VIBR|nr:AraC family transcriptional regulator [Vibrio galatheae]KJY81949.1 AraC family transcriptional regulator [Vibrio galatheae]
MEIVAQYLPTDHRHQLGVMDVTLLLNTLDDMAVNLDSVLDVAGLGSLSGCSKPNYMTYADKLRLFRSVAHQFSDTGIGLRIGSKAQLSHFGVLGYVILSSRTVEEAIKTGFKYLNLNGPVFSVQVVKQQGMVSIVLENTLDIGELLPFCSEYFLSAVAALFKQITGQMLAVRSLSLTYLEPTYRQEYRSCFGCEPEFEAAQLKLSFDAKLLDLTLRTHNADTLARCLASCDAVMSVMQSPYLLTNQIKTALYQSAGSFPSLDEMAVQFGCSARTLRRQLTQQRTSYKQLLAEARSDIAKEFLMQTQLTVEEIAFRLGYSDSASFRRGFKRWTRMTPQQFRGAS